MRVALADVEANGLMGRRGRDGTPVKHPDRIHCVCVLPIENGTQHPVLSYHDQPDIAERAGSIEDGLRLLENFDEVWFHNAIGYDSPCIKSLYPWWKLRGKLRDTLVMSHLVFPWIGQTDYRRKNFPKRLIGWHSVEAWGYRLGIPKDQLEGDPDEKWERFTERMLRYCERDVAVLAHLYQFLKKQRYPEKAIELEHRFAAYINRQMNNGVGLDESAAHELLARFLEFRSTAEDDLRGHLGKYTKRWTTPVKKLERVKEIQYDPGSHEQVARALIEKFKWRPETYTKKVRSWGRVPKLTEEVIRDLPDTITFKDTLVEWFVTSQRGGKIKELLKHSMFAEDLDQVRIFGYVNHNGAVTGRCTHSKPNINLPRVSTKYGEEMRGLLKPRPGWMMVGADLNGIEGRATGHFLSPFDGGAFARRAEDPRFHLLNQEAWGLQTKQGSKNSFYATIYGAQGARLGETIRKVEGRPYTERDGENLQRRILATAPGLSRFQALVLEKWRERGWLYGIDGRRIRPRKKSAVLNALFQGFGAVVMKAATILAEDALDDEFPGLWAPMLHVHDELQVECDPSIVGEVKLILVDAFEATQEYLGLDVAITGEAQEGWSWAETH